MDGSITKTGLGVGFLLIDPDHNECQYGLSFIFQASNNVVEYEALI